MIRVTIGRHLYNAAARVIEKCRLHPRLLQSHERRAMLDLVRLYELDATLQLARSPRRPA